MGKKKNHFKKVKNIAVSFSALSFEKQITKLLDYFYKSKFSDQSYMKIRASVCQIHASVFPKIDTFFFFFSALLCNNNHASYFPHSILRAWLTFLVNKRAENSIFW